MFHAPLSFHAQQDDIVVEGALQFNKGASHMFNFYVNGDPFTRGVPVSSLKEAVSRAVSMLARRLKISPEQPLGSTIWKRHRPAVSCVMSIRLWRPMYATAKRTVLANAELHQPVFRAVYAALSKALQEDPAFAKTLLEHIADSEPGLGKKTEADQ